MRSYFHALFEIKIIERKRKCLLYKIPIRPVQRFISTGCYFTFHTLDFGQVFQYFDAWIKETISTSLGGSRDTCMSKVNPVWHFQGGFLARIVCTFDFTSWFVLLLTQHLILFVNKTNRCITFSVEADPLYYVSRNIFLSINTTE